MDLPAFSYFDERLLLLGLVGLSIVLRSLSRWGSWGVRTRMGHTGRLAYRIRNLAQYPILREAGRWLFYLGIPYLALLAGIVNLRTLGLTWPAERTWPVLAFFGAVLLALLVAGWWHNTRVRPRRATPWIPAEWRSDPFGWARLWPDIVLHQSHWAFYRALPVAYMSGVAGPALGMLLVLIEWAMDPLWWRAMTRARLAPVVLLRLAMIAVSAFAFAVSGSSLPGLAFHLIAEPALLAISRWRVEVPAQ